MRAVIQRVHEARVEVDGTATGAIGPGLLVFLGVHHEDTQPDLEWLVGKILQLRIFPDAEARMNLSVRETGGGILLISQFTLYGTLRKGSRPSFNRAASPERATAFYEEAIKRLSFGLGRPVATGRFGEHMDIACEQDGPVTIILDSRDKGL